MAMTIITSTTAPQLTASQRSDIVATLTGGLQQVGGEAFDLFTDRPGFVAGSEPLSPLGSAVRALTRLNCRQWARADKAGMSPRVNAYNAQVCNPYLATLGEDPLAGGLGPGFAGGQCPGVSYTVGARFPPPTGRGDWTTFVSGPGPVSVSGGAVTDTGQFPNTKRTTWTVTFQGGFTQSLTLTHPEDQPPGFIVVTTDPGVSDSCGNEPPRIVPPQTRPGLPTISPTVQVQLPGLGPVNVTVNINPNGTINLGLPDLGFNFNVDPLGGGDGGGGGGGGGGNRPPGDVGEPGSPGVTGQGGEAGGEAGDGEVLTGLKIDFASPPVGGNEYAPGVYRGVCYVYMGTSQGLDHDPAGAMLSDGQFIFAEKDNLTRWRVSANMGYDLRVTPYYRAADAGGG